MPPTETSLLLVLLVAERQRLTAAMSAQQQAWHRWRLAALTLAGIAAPCMGALGVLLGASTGGLPSFIAGVLVTPIALIFFGAVRGLHVHANGPSPNPTAPKGHP